MLGAMAHQCGFVSLVPPESGPWTASGLPDEIILIGRKFRRSAWALPTPGVRAQYREDVPLRARHVEVLQDGTWRCSHVDEANPDHGLVLQHYFRDVLQTPWGLGLTVAGLLWLARRQG